MLALTLAQSVAALANLVTITAVLLFALFVVAHVAGWHPVSPHQRMMRERRQHAERTARSMRRMSQIRADTIRRMDEAERRWRP
jgi:hypothetical protein